jgi:uncharacterized protein involved in response to NO
VQQTDTPLAPGHPAILNLGFRPFFAAAAIYSILAVLAWSAMYLAGWHGPFRHMAAATWHAHEMIYGYSMAVIAGFLLTAVRNWTGHQTLHGYPLLLLVLVWLAARILFFTGDMNTLPFQALLDSGFFIGLIASLLLPITRTRQWKQLGILSMLLLLMVSNLVFHAGLSGAIEDGVRMGLYSGVYLIIALVLVMASRVFPFFIERGVGYPVKITNRAWLDVSGLFLYLAFWLAEMIQADSTAVAVCAFALTIVHVLKMAGWYTRGLWRKPLLWVLYLGYGWIVAGFALKAAVVLGVSPTLSLHAFAYGGIGVLTLGMMSRVSLGHTGRSVAEPPPGLTLMFSVLMIGAVTRVLLPLLDPAHYTLWIGLAQGLWLIAFLLFLYRFLPMLLQPRPDGQPG